MESEPDYTQMELRVLNKYRLIKKLGEGSFGAVYKAVDVDDGEEYAVKLVSLEITLKKIRLFCLQVCFVGTNQGSPPVTFV